MNFVQSILRVGMAIVLLCAAGLSGQSGILCLGQDGHIDWEVATSAGLCECNDSDLSKGSEIISVLIESSDCTDIVIDATSLVMPAPKADMEISHESTPVPALHLTNSGSLLLEPARSTSIFENVLGCELALSLRSVVMLI